MLRQNSGEQKTEYSMLDLSSIDNIIPASVKLKCVINIFIATYRHERFHGETFSPFRSSKAKLKTYAHAYFMLMTSYIVVLGMLHHRDKGGFSIVDLVNVAERSMHQFSSFFGDAFNE